MKALSLRVPFSLVAALFLGGVGVSHSQVVPATPTKFTTRELGNRGNSNSAVGATVVKPQTTARTITHIVLGEPRQWKMTDGKFFVGKLIAFEDLIAEAKLQPDAAPAAPPVVPAKPTVVRDGRARFYVDAKSYEVPLDRLGEDERKHVEQIRASIAAKK